MELYLTLPFGINKYSIRAVTVEKFGKMGTHNPKESKRIVWEIYFLSPVGALSLLRKGVFLP